MASRDVYAKWDVQAACHMILVDFDMASLDFCIERSGFGRQTNRGNGNGNGNRQANGVAAGSPTGTNPTSPSVGTASTSPYSSTSQLASDNGSMDFSNEPEPPKFFFMEKYAKLGVKGNFMPLAAQPKNVDLGDWLAHQAHEQYRVIEKVLECIQEVDSKTSLPICNPHGCPVMSAGRAYVYTWLNNKKEPVKVPAQKYIHMVQVWTCGKLSDSRVFPTDPITSAPSEFLSGGLNTSGSNTPIAMGPTTQTTSLERLSGYDWPGKATGFPESFVTDLKTIFRQIFRLYAHTYHSHWVDPFWHIQGSGNPPSSGWTDLNSCFVHFITVAKLFGLLSDRDMEPMQPLIDIWIANGAIPPEAAASTNSLVPQPPIQSPQPQQPVQQPQQQPAQQQQ